MTTKQQFFAKAKARHDYADMLQVRYEHANGEHYDTWVSGEEVMSRLNTQDRERLIKSFSQKNWEQAKRALHQEVEKGKEKTRDRLKGRLADLVQGQLGDNIFGDTLADNIRGVDSNEDVRAKEKALWQARLQDGSFRAVVLELAWISLAGSLPDEGDTAVSPDDWV
ncbi:MAG: hypothetical protein Kow0080_27400 [Candidatus Promineifilaceae bacterium]